jgi:hypothetical protein
MQMKSQIAGLVAAAMLLAAGSAARAVVVGQVDTFQDGSTANWSGGASPTNIAAGGPAGASDKFLEISSSGSGGNGGKLITFNRLQWLGSYTAIGAKSISMDLENLSSSPLTIRIAFKDGIGVGSAGYSSSDATAFTLAADSGWQHATFPLTDASFVGINGPGETFNSLLAGPAEFRILSSTVPALDGGAVSGPLGIDNVAVAVPEPTSASFLIGGAMTLLGKRRRR